MNYTSSCFYTISFPFIIIILFAKIVKLWQNFKMLQSSNCCSIFPNSTVGWWPAVPPPPIEGARVARAGPRRRPRGHQACPEHSAFNNNICCGCNVIMIVGWLRQPFILTCWHRYILSSHAGTNTFYIDLLAQVHSLKLTFLCKPLLLGLLICICISLLIGHLYFYTFLCKPLALELGVLVCGIRGIW